jgi:hypothetical protein
VAAERPGVHPAERASAELHFHHVAVVILLLFERNLLGVLVSHDGGSCGERREGGRKR